MGGISRDWARAPEERVKLQKARSRGPGLGAPSAQETSGSSSEGGSQRARGPQGQVQKVSGGSGGDSLTQMLLVGKEDEAWALPVGFSCVITKTSMRASLMAE